jgi:hypothetical protein
MYGKIALILIIIFLPNVVYSHDALKVVVVANSIDYQLAQDFFDFLRDKGIEVLHLNASEFPKYKNEKFIIILGGHRAYAGVGEIAGQVLLPEERSSIEIAGNKKLFFKTNIWSKGQVVIVIAGSNRHQTRQAHNENRAIVIENLKEAAEKISTSIEVFNITIRENESAIIKARLIDENGNSLAGKKLSFYLKWGEKLGSAMTDEEGFASISYKPKNWGVYNILVSFPEDATYAQSQAEGTLKVAPLKIPTSLRMAKPIFIGESREEVTLVAVLEDILELVMNRGSLKTAIAKPISGKTISFTVDETLAGTAVTDSDGQASLNFTIPSTWISGYKEIEVSFLGSSEYSSSQGSGRLAITSATARLVRINEVELNPAGDDRSVGEWIEFYNPSSYDINLEGWRLGLARFEILQKEIAPPLYIPLFGTIPAKGYFVKTFYKGIFGDENEFTLLDVAGNEVDRTPILSDYEDNNKAWGRYPDGMDTNSNSDWKFRNSSKGGVNKP